MTILACYIIINIDESFRRSYSSRIKLLFIKLYLFAYKLMRKKIDMHDASNLCLDTNYRVIAEQASQHWLRVQIGLTIAGACMGSWISPGRLLVPWETRGGFVDLYRSLSLDWNCTGQLKQSCIARSRERQQSFGLHSCIAVRWLDVNAPTQSVPLE